MRRFVRRLFARRLLPHRLAGLAIDRQHHVAMRDAGLPPIAACCASPAAPVGMAVSRYSRSPHTTGVADPRPGTSTFQRMFFVSLHSMGGVAVRDTPVPCGPRHCGQ
jgi:hypothetical protein